MVKNRLQRTAEVMEALRRIVVNGVWIAIVLVVLGALGWFIVATQLEERQGGKSASGPVVKELKPQLDWQAVNADVAEAMQEARLAARTHAADRLEGWIGGMMERVDESFLPWYFSYWTQQMLGLKGLYQHGVHYVIESQPTASEKLTEEIQAEFAARVLKPQIAQKVLERIINETAAIYVADLQESLGKIQAQYAIEQIRWQEYLEDIAITAGASEGGRHTPLTLKALTVSGAGGAALLAVKMQTALAKAGTKMMATSSGKAASALAAKTGGKVVAKAGGKFFGTIVGVGVLIWDVWDHHATERESRPQLRSSLQDYLQELKILLLDDPSFGIMSTFTDLEHQIAGRKHYD